MRESPILFSGEMVRGILDDRKNQTRRVVADYNSQGNYRASELLLNDPRTFVDGGRSPAGNAGPYLHAYVDAPKIEARHGWEKGGCDPEIMDRLYPRYEVGGRLYVRENVWRDERASNVAIYAATPELAKYDDGTRGIVRASHPDNSPAPTREYMQREMESNRFWHLKPSIHMPRWASRITLEVTAVRVERVQEISEQDAIAEGLPFNGSYYLGGVHRIKGTPKCWTLAAQAYRALWDNLNAKRGYGWDVNPWVWVIEFKRLTESVKAAA